LVCSSPKTSTSGKNGIPGECSVARAVRITDVEPIVLRVGEVDTGRADGTQDAFLVRLHTDEGIVGVGEADTSPYVARTIVEMPSSHSIARGLAELLVGQNPLEIDRLWQLMFAGSDHYGRGGAALHTISAIDIALWDIAGKASGQRVCELLGGARVPELPVYASEVMPETADEVQAIGRRAVDAGYGALKLGWGPLGKDLDHDEELVRAAREVLGPARSLMLDGGRAYTVKRALELLRRLEDLELYWLEEPLEPDDYDGYNRLSDTASIRIAAGEADSCIGPFRRLVEHGHVDVLQPDIARCGGFTVAREIGQLARGRSVEVVPHCFSTGVLVAASLHFAATLDRPTYSEYSVADSPLVNGLLSEPFQLVDGKLAVPTGPGLGVDLSERVVERMRVS
jgi:L-rhamnonate dehydratase